MREAAARGAAALHLGDDVDRHARAALAQGRREVPAGGRADGRTRAGSRAACRLSRRSSAALAREDLREVASPVAVIRGAPAAPLYDERRRACVGRRARVDGLLRPLHALAQVRRLAHHHQRRRRVEQHRGADPERSPASSARSRRALCSASPPAMASRGTRSSPASSGVTVNVRTEPSSRSSATSVAPAGRQLVQPVLRRAPPTRACCPAAPARAPSAPAARRRRCPAAGSARPPGSSAAPAG